jgi:hypothetical protein
MLEVIFLIWFGRKLANVAASRGRSRGWAGLGVGFWIGGELMGIIHGSLLGLELGVYGMALGLAAVGAVTSYMIVSSLPAGDQPGPEKPAVF